MNKLKHFLGMALYYYIFVSIAFFLAPYVVSQGVSQNAIGFYASAALIILIFSTVISSYLADRYFSNKKIIIFNLVLSLIAFLLLISKPGTLLIIILFFVLWGTFMMIAPIIDALIIKDLGDINYAKIRAGGSIGAASSYFVNSYMLGDSSFIISFIINIFMLLVLITIILSLSERRFISKLNYREGIKVLVANKKLVYLMIITFTTYGTLSADDAYTFIFETEIVGISAAVIGIIGFISIGSETSFMYFSNFIRTKLGNKKSLYVATTTLFIIFVSKRFLFEFPFIINFTNVLLGLFIGLFIPVAIHIINNETDGSVKNTMLGIYQICIRLGGIVIGFITALFYSLTNELQDIYLLHAAIILIALFFISRVSDEHQS